MPSARSSWLIAIDWRLLLRLRAIGVGVGVAVSAVFALVLWSMLGPTQAFCLAHFTYPMGEALALAGASTLVRDRATLLAHAISTVVLAAVIGWNCQLWIALATGAPPSAIHPM